MSFAVLLKLAGIVAVVAIGWAAGRMKWLDAGGNRGDSSRTLSNAAFYIFVPALLFRTTARVDFSTMPWGAIAAVFVPTLALLIGLYGVQRRRHRGRALPVAAPGVRAISAVFGNTVQIGIPLATSLYGETGLALHLAIVSLHALVLLTSVTALVELDLAATRPRHPGGEASHLAAVLATTVRNTVIHPVVLPVLLGLGFNALGWVLPAIVDEVLQTLGTAVVPLCLVMIGSSLAQYGLRGEVRHALGVTAVKLLLLPALVLVVAHWGFGIGGLPLAVIVTLAALPVGSNPLIFAQRYGALEAETTAAVVLSTLAFVVTAPFWLAVLARIG